jgi:hypothetical protein
MPNHLFCGPFQPEDAFEVNGEGFEGAYRDHRLSCGLEPLPPRFSVPTSVSIVIAGRNYANFLPEAIHSAINQTIPCEVIYSDDGSSDDSVEIARQFEEVGLVVIATSTNQGVVSARNRGFHASRGHWIINLDADDALPINYVEKMLEAATPSSPFCYGAAHAFGKMSLTWNAPEWGTESLWIRNFVNTSAMYSRAAWTAAGGWQEFLGTMWDWSLSLRASRFGKPAKANTGVFYRIHDNSFSEQYNERDESKLEVLLARGRRMVARLSVGSILSGRLPDLFPAWLEKLAHSVRHIPLSQKPDLTLLNNSDNPRFARMVAKECARFEAQFGCIRILPFPVRLAWEGELERRGRVAELLADACNKLHSEMPGEVHWHIEDDVMVPRQGGEVLWESLTAGCRPPAAVTGVYRSRHLEHDLIGGWWKCDKPVELKRIPERRLRLDFAGMGCVMYWKDRVPDWLPYWCGVAAHDWNWGCRLKRTGGRLMMLPEVRCGHAVSASEIVEV